VSSLLKLSSAGRRLTPVLLALGLPLVAYPPAYPQQCKLAQLGELPVTMRGTRPLVHAAINGTDALFIADSGAAYSTITQAAAEAYKLPLRNAPVYVAESGVGGEAHTMISVVRTLTLFGQPIPNVDFFVIEQSLDPGVAGLIGQNVFRLGDVEYDLAHNVIRIMRTEGCRNTPLAYWAAADSKPFSVIDIDTPTRFSPHTTSVAYVNGSQIRVLFDTGAARSTLTLEAAKRAGVTPESAGVVAGGEWRGIGSGTGRTWIAPFASFKIGDEEIRNTHLRIGAEKLSVDMLLGADFFLSHRIYVATGQRKLYFTYNGGPVFDLKAGSPAQPPAPPPPGPH
jgi:Aspartyl protease/gag-polyprotein putative aspartyl protease